MNAYQDTNGSELVPYDDGSSFRKGIGSGLAIVAGVVLVVLVVL